MQESDSPVRPLSARGQRRREALIEAAQALFLEQGYSGTSLADIVARGGGSLSTLYELFGGKDGLFRAMIQSATEQLFDEISLPPVTRDNLEQALSELILGFALHIQDPERIAMQRAIVSEAAKFPDLAEAFYTGGVRKGLDLFAHMVRELQKQGLLRDMDADLAALCLLEPVLGHIHRLLLVGAEVPTGEALRRHTHFVVNMFLQAAACSPE